MFEDLGPGQISIEPEESTGTKDTAHGTADLRADADGPSAGFSHQHTLDLSAIDQFDQQFFGAVPGDLVPDQLTGEEVKVVAELFSERGRQIGHLFDRFGLATEDPFPDLGGPVGRMIVPGQPVAHLLGGNSAEGGTIREGRLGRWSVEWIGGGHDSGTLDVVGSSTVVYPR